MFRNKIFGIAAAATLGLAAVLGSTAAHAVKVCTSAPTDRAGLEAATCADSTTFALETALEGATNTTAASDSSDTATYYNIATGQIILAAPADIGGGGDDYTVTVTLSGMVFSTAPSLAATGGTSPAFGTASGGTAGDAAVEFELSSGLIDATESVLVVTGDFAVSAGGGTATLTVANPSLQGTKTATHGPANVVVMAAALDEKVVALNATADVAADGFLKFVDSRTTASLGTVEIGYKAMHRLLSDGSAADALSDIMQIGNNTAGEPNSSVSFSGDFSFASRVFLHGDGDCGAATGDAHIADPNSDTDLASAETDLRVMEGMGDDAMVTGTTMAVTVETLTSGATPPAPLHLCIMVVDPDADGAMPIPIPPAEAYTAMGSYTALADAAIGPVPEEQTLGRIRRNGVTYHLPYLTVNAKYSQRLRIVNRGPEANYAIDYHGDGDIGLVTDGMLDEDSITVMLVGGDNAIVMPGGDRKSTSATLMIEGQSKDIDVATTQTNRDTGASDTVVYTRAPMEE